MGNEKDSKTPATVAPKQVAQPAAGLSEQQFVKLQKTLLYSAAVFGFLAGGKRPTPTKANLAELQSYADAVMELVG